METLKTKKTVKMNLTLTQEFYDLLQQNAKNDYVRTATWTKQFLMKNLCGDKLEKKCLTENGTVMGN